MGDPTEGTGGTLVTGRGSPPRKKKQSLHLEIPMKPLSTNKMYSGVKRRSVYYKRFSREVFQYLNENYDPRGLSLKGNLRFTLEIGVSSPLFDASNSIKAIEDIIVKWSGSFDDRQVYSLHVEKYLVNKGEEYMKLSFTKLRSNRDRRYKR